MQQFHLLLNNFTRLFNKPEIGNAPLPALQRLLGKVRAQTWQRDFHSGLFACFKLPSHTPVAPLTALYDNGCAEGFWLRSDPVHLYADRQRLILFDSGLLQVGQIEAGQITADLNRFFAEERLFFQAPVAQRWYLRPEQHTDFTTHPLAEVRGADVQHYLPGGVDGTYWRTRLNEIQMFLHQHGINQYRENAKALPLNSVWLWGQGQLPPTPACDWDAVWHNDDPLAGGLARMCKVPEKVLSTAMVDELFALPADSKVLAVMHFNPQDDLHGLDNNCFTPLLQALEEGCLQRLSLYPGNALRFDIEKKDLGRWWRLSKNITDYFAETGNEQYS